MRKIVVAVLACAFLATLMVAPAGATKGERASGKGTMSQYDGVTFAFSARGTGTTPAEVVGTFKFSRDAWGGTVSGDVTCLTVYSSAGEYAVARLEGQITKATVASNVGKYLAWTAVTYEPRGSGIDLFTVELSATSVGCGWSDPDATVYSPTKGRVSVTDDA